MTSLCYCGCHGNQLSSKLYRLTESTKNAHYMCQISNQLDECCQKKRGGVLLCVTFFTNLRVNFLEHLLEQNSQLQYLNLECLFKYIITMSDMRIVRKCARYCFEILETYRKTEVNNWI